MVERACVACWEAAILRQQSLAARRVRLQSAGDRAAAAADRFWTREDPLRCAVRLRQGLAVSEQGALEREPGSAELDAAASRTTPQSKSLPGFLDGRDAPDWKLHDDVVQTLYGVGIALQAVLPEAEHPELRGWLEQAVSDIDGVVASLRSHISQRVVERAGAPND